MRRAVATEIRDDHAVARSCEHGRDIDKAVNVVGPAVQKNHNGSVRGTGLCVTHIQYARIDLLQRSERGIRSGLDCRHFCPHPLCCRRTDHPELSGGDRHRGGGKETASILVNLVHDLIHWAASTIGHCAADQPNVKAKASTPGPRNSIWNCRSAMGLGCRISWYSRCSVTVP